MSIAKCGEVRLFGDGVNDDGGVIRKKEIPLRFVFCRVCVEKKMALAKMKCA